MDPLTIFAALIPAGIDMLKSLVAKKTGNVPAVTTAKDYAEVIDADVRKLEALAKLDTPTGPVSAWVNNVRSMQRPAAIAAVLVVWLAGAVGLADMGPERFTLVSNLAASVFFFLFGDRVNFHIKKEKA